MKGEKLDGNLEKGFGMLRKDNQPQRARSSSYPQKAKRGDSASDNSEGRRETHFVARL